MVVESGGQFAGSVSGGCVEAAVIEAAMQSLSHHQAQTLEFGISDHQGVGIWTACGGKISLMIQPSNRQTIRQFWPPSKAESGLAGLLIFDSVQQSLVFVKPSETAAAEFDLLLASNRSQMIGK